MLGSNDIRQFLKRRDLVIKPHREDAVQPASYDLRLGAEIVVPLGKLDERDGYSRIQTARVDPRLDMTPAAETIHFRKKHGYRLHPGAFVLATTKEWVELPMDLVARVDGRSSVGRLGLFVENAGFIDPGFRGEITLELFNASGRDLIIYPDMPIAQLSFDRVTSPEDAVRDFTPLQKYDGKYMTQSGPTPSRIHQNWNAETQEWT